MRCASCLQALQSYLEAEKAVAAAAVTEGPLAAAQAQLAEVQVGRHRPATGPPQTLHTQAHIHLVNRRTSCCECTPCTLLLQLGASTPLQLSRHFPECCMEVMLVPINVDSDDNFVADACRLSWMRLRGAWLKRLGKLSSYAGSSRRSMTTSKLVCTGQQGVLVAGGASD